MNFLGAINSANNDEDDDKQIDHFLMNAGSVNSAITSSLGGNMWLPSAVNSKANKGVIVNHPIYDANNPEKLETSGSYSSANKNLVESTVQSIPSLGVPFTRWPHPSDIDVGRLMNQGNKRCRMNVDGSAGISFEDDSIGGPIVPCNADNVIDYGGERSTIYDLAKTLWGYVVPSAVANPTESQSSANKQWREEQVEFQTGSQKQMSGITTTIMAPMVKQIQSTPTSTPYGFLDPKLESVYVHDISLTTAAQQQPNAQMTNILLSTS